MISKLEDDICRKIAWDFRNNPDDWKYRLNNFDWQITYYEKGDHEISIYDAIYPDYKLIYVDGVKASDIWSQHILRTLGDDAKKKQVIALTDKLSKLECL